MKQIFTLLVVAASFIIIKDGFTSPTGIANKTNAPGETNCTVGCHNSFALNSGGGSIVINCPTLVGWTYTPGVTYPISVTVSKTGVNKYGFNFEALQSTGANAGTLVITNATETKTLSGNIAGNLRTTVTHKAVANSTGTHTFNFNWIAPATSVGNVTFYTAGNCANGNNNTSGDYIYTASQVVTPSTAGIADYAGEVQNLIVFPNPVADFVNVHFSNNKSQAVKIELFDLNGRFQELLLNDVENAGIKLFRFNFTERYSTGVYLLKVMAGDNVSYKKIYISNN